MLSTTTENENLVINCYGCLDQFIRIGTKDAQLISEFEEVLMEQGYFLDLLQINLVQTTQVMLAKLNLSVTLFSLGLRQIH